VGAVGRKGWCGEKVVRVSRIHLSCRGGRAVPANPSHRGERIAQARLSLNDANLVKEIAVGGEQARAAQARARARRFRAGSRISRRDRGRVRGRRWRRLNSAPRRSLFPLPFSSSKRGRPSPSSSERRGSRTSEKRSSRFDADAVLTTDVDTPTSQLERTSEPLCMMVAWTLPRTPEIPMRPPLCLRLFHGSFPLPLLFSSDSSAPPSSGRLDTQAHISLPLLLVMTIPHAHGWSPCDTHIADAAVGRVRGWSARTTPSLSMSVRSTTGGATTLWSSYVPSASCSSLYWHTLPPPAGITRNTLPSFFAGRAHTHLKIDALNLTSLHISLLSHLDHLELHLLYFTNERRNFTRCHY
jgi:hypothetical protein